MAPDYSVGFAKKAAIVMLLSIMMESKPLDNRALIQWLARPGTSHKKALNTVTLLIFSNIIEEVNEHTVISDSFGQMVSDVGVESVYKDYVLHSVPEESLRLFVRNANVLDTGTIIWPVDSISPFLAGLRDFLLSLDMLLLNSGYMESTEKLEGRLKTLGLLRNLERTNDSTLHMTPEVLLAQLQKKDENGRFAEAEAMKFERKRLTGSGKEPLRVSAINVATGYDIDSYMDAGSASYDRFIEVKSCSDSTFRFFISKNELETARNKGNSYFLYLYNRNSKQFRIVQNPYGKIFENEEWVKEPQIFEIHQIK